MNYEKIYKILMEIVGDQNNVVIESTLKRKEDSTKKEVVNERESYWKQN